MFARALLIAAIGFAVAVGGGLAGCERTDHEAIDRWLHTAKGPAKLHSLVGDDRAPAELAAHAAANLIKRGDDPIAYAALEAMAPPRRSEVVAQLVPRLWDIARVEAETELPQPPQVAAKDALVRVRRWADEATRQALDTYLVSWYCVASYEDRAKTGATLGASAIRLVGAAAAPKLMSVADAVIAAPGQNQIKNRIGDELLLGLAATGSAASAKYVLDIARLDRGDPTLSTRALTALYRAYVDPDGLFPVAAPDGLVGNLPALVAIAKDDGQPTRVANDAVALIRAAGAPHCLAPLLGMIAAPHRDPDFKWVAANNALICGGAAAILDTVRAMPDAGAYTEDQVTGIALAISRLAPRSRVQDAARALLAERSTVSVWVGIETLAAIKASDDAPRVAGLAARRERLIGYWGARGQGKDDPTLGERARQVSVALAGK